MMPSAKSSPRFFLHSACSEINMAFLAFPPIIGQIIDRILPDPTKAAEAKLELAKLEMSGDLQTILAQLEINKVEAASTSIFVAGWRPFIGWVCGSSLAYNYMAQPFLVFLADLVGRHPALPN